MKPILYSTEMVQAILQGRKTQTRRLVKGTALEWLNDFIPEFVADPLNNLSKYSAGDVLYVRETTCWVMRDHTDLLEGMDSQIVYKASVHEDWMEYAKEKYGYKWTPSVFMPKDAARIFLKVTKVRIERLQDITNNDCIAEGIEVLSIPELPEHVVPFKDYQNKDNYFQRPDYSFESLWEKINGKGSWKQNPWVWVYEFERVHL